MAKEITHLISPDRLGGVERALLSLFGINAPNSIAPLQGGYSSSQMFLIDVQGKRYVLRVMGFDQPIEDRQTQINCASYASQMGLSPHYHYTHAEDGVIIMDYIEITPFTKEIILQKLPQRLRALHHPEEHGATMPPPHIKIFSYLQGLMEEVIALDAPQSVLDFIRNVQALMPILKATQRENVLACCHNDLNVSNLIYDGRELYFVDFEAAGYEDPYFDLATLSLQMLFTEEETHAFLHDYFKRAPTSFDLQKTLLMKQVSYAFYAMHFFKFAYQQGVMSIENTPIPTLAQWDKGMGDGTFELATPHGFLIYALTLMNDSLKEMGTESFFEAKKSLVT